MQPAFPHGVSQIQWFVCYCCSQLANQKVMSLRSLCMTLFLYDPCITVPLPSGSTATLELVIFFYFFNEVTIRSAVQKLSAVPQTRLKTKADRVFCVMVPQLQNSLPLSVRPVDSTAALSASLKLTFTKLCETNFSFPITSYLFFLLLFYGVLFKLYCLTYLKCACFSVLILVFYMHFHIYYTFICFKVMEFVLLLAFYLFYMRSSLLSASLTKHFTCSTQAYFSYPHFTLYMNLFMPSICQCVGPVLLGTVYVISCF